MNATACDLKSAYVHFTKGSIIVEEILPSHRRFSQCGVVTQRAILMCGTLPMITT